MSGASYRKQLRGITTRFITADEGNIAVIFAIALVPLLGFVGAAVDYTRANAARSSMQAALDSTALMVSKDLTQGIITTSDLLRLLGKGATHPAPQSERIILRKRGPRKRPMQV